jgi:hypothetical protein
MRRNVAEADERRKNVAEKRLVRLCILHEFMKERFASMP